MGPKPVGSGTGLDLAIETKVESTAVFSCRRTSILPSISSSSSSWFARLWKFGILQTNMSGHDSKYFSTTKKGEIPELKEELNSQYKAFLSLCTPLLLQICIAKSISRFSFFDPRSISIQLTDSSGVWFFFESLYCMGNSQICWVWGLLSLLSKLAFEYLELCRSVRLLKGHRCYRKSILRWICFLSQW